MEQLEKEFCLFVFARLLKNYNENFIVTDPVYDNTQPSRSIEKSIIKFVFYDDMLGLTPHAANGITSDSNAVYKLVLFTIVGRKCPQ